LTVDGQQVRLGFHDFENWVGGKESIGDINWPWVE
jgi:hypothetical protein